MEKNDSYCEAATIGTKRVVSIPFIRQEGFTMERFFQKGVRKVAFEKCKKKMNEKKQ